MFGSKKHKIDYLQSITGTWGEFRVADSHVAYLQTKARIGKAAADSEKRLAGQLRPVREVLPTSTMDFNQLLQRDLDDHRVAANLVRYILQPASGRPVFFPPVVAALLPFDGSNVKPQFPSSGLIEPYTDTDGANWSGYAFGTSFKFEKFVYADTGEDYPIKIGNLSWNPEEAKLVVIDGQHRAMALLAIDRTLNGTWSESGEKYKYFYEPIIDELTKGLSDIQKNELVSQLEFPVNIVWFPDSNDQEPRHHEVARRLFVDINKNARTPSESRILLLSDNDLVSIFTRSLLNEFRTDGAGLPIYAVEYDHPGRDQASSSKWSAVSNVIILRDAVVRAVFGPEKYISDVTSNFAGRESYVKRGDFMRKTLRISDEVPEILTDMKRSEIVEDKFPRDHLDFFQARFKKTWGGLIFKLLSEVEPFKTHGQALQQLKSGWATAGSTDTLAKDAIFEGVGMYWTIRDAYLHWEAENRLLEDANQKPKPQTDIVKTWRVLNTKADEFRKLRAKLYLGKDAAPDVNFSDASFDVFGTNACQIGLVLAIRSIAFKENIAIESLPAYFDIIIKALNEGLRHGGHKAYARKIFVSRLPSDGGIPRLNLIPKLDTPLSVYFRYFWLEVLCTTEAAEAIANGSLSSTINSLRDQARGQYLRYVATLNEKAARAQSSNKTPAELKKEAYESAVAALSAAIEYWFGVQEPQWKLWIESLKDVPAPVEQSEPADDDVTLEGADESGESEVS